MLKISKAAFIASSMDNRRELCRNMGRKQALIKHSRVIVPASFRYAKKPRAMFLRVERIF